MKDILIESFAVIVACYLVFSFLALELNYYQWLWSMKLVFFIFVASVLVLSYVSWRRTR